MDLLDDRVMPVGLVGCDGVEDLGVGGGEERVEAAADGERDEPPPGEHQHRTEQDQPRHGLGPVND